MRQKILALAGDLFMKQGYLLTSTRQIASLLGITQPALYHHFKNKEKLYTEVVLDYAERIGQDLNEIVNQNEPITDTLISMSNLLKSKYPMNFLMMMHDLKHELSQEAQMEIYHIWFSHFYTPFDKVFLKYEQNLMEPLSVKDVTTHFLRIIQTYVSNEEQYVVETPIELNQIIRIFIRGIKK